jgi:hypothetical protein
VEELNDPSSSFSRGLDSPHGGDVGSETSPVVCVGDKSLRDYWMVFYGHNIPKESPDVLEP